MITTAVAVMLLWQLLPVERRQESTQLQELVVRDEVKPPHIDSATILLGAIRLPSPPAVKMANQTPRSNQVDESQDSNAVKQPDLQLTPLQPRPVIKQEQESRTQDKRWDNEMDVNQNKQNSLHQGRVFLKILEHGEGPGIEIAWPSKTQQREDLYQLLHRCFGMRTAMMNNSGLLYRHDTPTGQPWRPNLDRFSGFIRQPQGYLARQETSEAEQIKRHHRLGNGALPVRIFPRQSDALLLGGLHQLLGAEYATAQQIQGVYKINGPNLFISSIRKDNRPVAGQIHLTPTQRCR